VTRSDKRAEPEWNQEFLFPLQDSMAKRVLGGQDEKLLLVGVYERKTFVKDALLGGIQIKLSKLMAHQPMNRVFKVGRDGVKLHLRLWWVGKQVQPLHKQYVTTNNQQISLLLAHSFRLFPFSLALFFSCFRAGYEPMACVCGVCLPAVSTYWRAS